MRLGPTRLDAWGQRLRRSTWWAAPLVLCLFVGAVFVSIHLQDGTGSPGCQEEISATSGPRDCTYGSLGFAISWLIVDVAFPVAGFAGGWSATLGFRRAFFRGRSWRARASATTEAARALDVDSRTLEEYHRRVDGLVNHRYLGSTRLPMAMGATWAAIAGGLLLLIAGNRFSHVATEEASKELYALELGVAASIVGTAVVLAAGNLAVNAWRAWAGARASEERAVQQLAASILADQRPTRGDAVPAVSPSFAPYRGTS